MFRKWLTAFVATSLGAAAVLALQIALQSSKKANCSALELNAPEGSNLTNAPAVKNGKKPRATTADHRQGAPVDEINPGPFATKAEAEAAAEAWRKRGKYPEVFPEDAPYGKSRWIVIVWPSKPSSPDGPEG
jgi:hypothetical protein